MPANRPFAQIDVFTASPGYGNPVAVVLDAAGLHDAALQRFARWTNLSETTFVLPPTDARADYALRIFTPGGELPFAGHPTLGSCFAWRAAGGVPKAEGRIVQQCAKGLIELRHDGARPAFAAPPLARRDPAPALLAQVSAALGLRAQQIARAQLLDNGPVWLALWLTDAQAVLALAPDHARLKNLGQKVGVAGAYSSLFATSSIANPGTDEPPGIEVRAFAAPIGVDEDPVTGSFNASLAQW
ncbi:MAG: PhzF family phenazine biosynthesis protein, partial [Proteobacteria bacterium]|nr:PhzF family phenazine biosynthesis protein [Pseudomonadota bacterium]